VKRPQINIPWIVLTGFLAVMLALPSSAQQFSEQDVKAVLLYNAMKFIKWPETTFESKNTPLRLCVFGEDLFSNSLNLLKGKPIQGHPIQLHRVKKIPAIDNECQALYMASVKRTSLKSVLDAVKDESVLTISNYPEFAERGGVLALVEIDGFAKLVINSKASSQANLAVNSQLLELAIVVDGSNGEG
jgi:hypothetical protein